MEIEFENKLVSIKKIKAGLVVMNYAPEKFGHIEKFSQNFNKDLCIDVLWEDSTYPESVHPGRLVWLYD
jgi:hypothetical protein